MFIHFSSISKGRCVWMKPLSEKVHIFKGWHSANNRFHHTKDVAEAVQSEKDLCIEMRDSKMTWYEFFKKRDEIFGEFK